MRFRVFVCVMIAVVVPVALVGETVYLTDGSTLRGKVKKYENDTLHLETSFGGVVKIEKSKIARVDFDGSDTIQVPPPPVTGASFENAVPGTLQVAFEKVKFTTRINVERGKDREAVERENSIEQRLLVSGKRMHSHIDSVTDKVVRNGPDTTLRNDFEANDFQIILEPNMYHLTLLFGNTLADQYIDQFDSKPLERELAIDNISIEPGKITRIRVGMKRKKWSVSKHELYVVK